jgi:hypothetical protein
MRSPRVAGSTGKNLSGRKQPLIESGDIAALNEGLSIRTRLDQREVCPRPASASGSSASSSGRSGAASGSGRPCDAVLCG